MQTPIRFLAALSLSFLIAGCQSPNANDDQHRGPIGKADMVGSCTADTCGGQAEEGDCWCDELCAFYGDCCPNKVETCDAPQAKSCGGFAGLLCDDGDYCHYEQDQSCGFADQMGTCLPIPQLCTQEFGPVCGCDGQTYGNSCEASASGTSVAHDGTCAATLCLSDDGCDAGMECDHTECLSNCPAGMICPAVCWGECKPTGVPLPTATCEGNCGGPAAQGACYCDDKCEGFGDCCDDYDAQCSARTPAAGFCVKNSNDNCTTDVDCTNGGCGGELCYNPALDGGISTCECTMPTNVAGCGCVAGKCTWYNN